MCSFKPLGSLAKKLNRHVAVYFPLKLELVLPLDCKRMPPSEFPPKLGKPGFMPKLKPAWPDVVERKTSGKKSNMLLVCMTTLK